MAVAAAVGAVGAISVALLRKTMLCAVAVGAEVPCAADRTGVGAGACSTARTEDGPRPKRRRKYVVCWVAHVVGIHLPGIELMGDALAGDPAGGVGGHVPGGAHVRGIQRWWGLTYWRLPWGVPSSWIPSAQSTCCCCVSSLHIGAHVHCTCADNMCWDLGAGGAQPRNVLNDRMSWRGGRGLWR